MDRSLRDFVEIDALMHMGRVIELGCRADREPRMRVQTVNEGRNSFCQHRVEQSRAAVAVKITDGNYSSISIVLVVKKSRVKSR